MLQNQDQNHYINHIKRLPCEPSESQSQILTDQQSECDGEGAIQQFKREIEERFRLSVANKLYSFPRSITSVDDLISSDQSSGESDNEEPLKPISKANITNEVLQSQRVVLSQKQLSKPFKKKDTSYIGQDSYHRAQKDPQVGSFEKVLKIKKKSGKQKSKQKRQECWKQTKQKGSQRNKRFNTQPDSHDYVHTFRTKNRK